MELFQVGAGGGEIARGQVAPGLRTAIAVTEGDIYLFKDNGQEIDRHVAADRPGNREFSVGERPPGNPQVAIAPGAHVRRADAAVNQLLEDQKKQAFQTYFTRSGNVALEQQLLRRADGDLTCPRRCGDLAQRRRPAPLRPAGHGRRQRGDHVPERPALEATSGGSAGKWFMGNVTLDLRPSDSEAFADTVWPRAENDYSSVSITDTTSWNATLSANANGGASPSVGGGPSFGIGGSSSKSVASNIKDYQPLGGRRSRTWPRSLRMDGVRHLGQAQDDGQLLLPRPGGHLRRDHRQLAQPEGRSA